MTEVYKSPRQTEQEVKAYQYQRFECYMQMVDDGVLTQELALEAFQEEIGNLDDIWTPEVQG